MTDEERARAYVRTRVFGWSETRDVEPLAQQFREVRAERDAELIAEEDRRIEQARAEGFEQGKAELAALEEGGSRIAKRVAADFQKRLTETRIATLDELYQAMGALVADACCDKQGQHYGIASCRELVSARITQLMKARKQDADP